MKLNKKQKVNHPHAKHIPDAVWDGLFEDTLPDYLVPLMKAAEARIFTELAAAVPHININKNKQLVWLAIVYSHPQLSSENLVKIAKQLDMPDSLLFHTAVISGKKSVLQVLEAKYTDTNWLNSIILFDKYKAFKNAAKYGQLEVLKYLASKAPLQRSKLTFSEEDILKGDFSHPHKFVVDTVQDMIASDDYYAYKWAAYYGSLDTIKYLEEQVNGGPDILQKMLASKNYCIFDYACERGNLDIFKYLETKVSPDIIQKKIEADQYDLFRDAARYGRVEMFQYLVSKASLTQLQAMIKANNFEVFHSAASQGDLNMLKYFESLLPEELKEMIAADDYSAYASAASSGEIEVLKYLESKVSPKELEDMIKAKDYMTFKWAAHAGQILVFEHLENKLGRNSKIFQDMLVSDNYRVFANACSGGNLDLVKYLANKASPETLQKMIKAQDYNSYVSAAQGGHVEVMKYLESIAPKEDKAMNKAGNYSAFRRAAKFHRLDVVQYLEAKWPKSLKKMIKVGKYDAFDSISDWWRDDTSYSKLEMFRYLAKKVPNKLSKILERQSSSLLTDIFFDGDANLLRYMAANVRPGYMQKMFKSHEVYTKAELESLDAIKCIDEQLATKTPSRSILHPIKKLINHAERKEQEQEDPSRLQLAYKYFVTALASEKFEVINYFLTNPKIFYLASNKEGNIYGEYLDFFVEDQLTAFRDLSMKAKQSNTVFDLTLLNEITLSYCMLRYCLAKNDASLSNDIQFLLEIPALQTCLKKISQDTKEELWKFAILENNKGVEELLAVILEKNQVSNPIKKLMSRAQTKELGTKTKESLIDSKPELIRTTGNSKCEVIIEVDSEESYKQSSGSSEGISEDARSQSQSRRSQPSSGEGFFSRRQPDQLENPLQTTVRLAAGSWFMNSGT